MCIEHAGQPMLMGKYSDICETFGSEVPQDCAVDYV
jgi:hypothetical protein